MDPKTVIMSPALKVSSACKEPEKRGHRRSTAWDFSPGTQAPLGFLPNLTPREGAYCFSLVGPGCRRETEAGNSGIHC